LAVWLGVPVLLPVMVSEYVRRLVNDAVLIVSVDVVPVDLGENVTVEPDGAPARLSDTMPANPLRLVTVTVYVAVEPRLTDCDDGLTDNEKSGAA